MSGEITREWLLSAFADLKSVRHIMGDDFLTHVAGFHSQQCVEKCLKAVLEHTACRVPKEHSTLKLYGLIKSSIDLAVDPDILTDLDDLYIDARYPGELGLLPHGKPTVEVQHW